jgi:membrane associated rhomboid family serine protease
MSEQVEDRLGRKYYIAIIYSASLLAVLVFMVLMLRDKFDAVMFGAWLAAFGTGVISYVMGNVAVAGAAAKAAAPSSTTTSTSTSTSKTESKEATP